jgi:hypothetical protein
MQNRLNCCNLMYLFYFGLTPDWPYESLLQAVVKELDNTCNKYKTHIKFMICIENVWKLF